MFGRGCFRLVLVFAAVCSLSAAGNAKIICVKWDSPTDGPGTDWAGAFHTVTSALAVAISGDQIWVAGDADHPYLERITLKNGVMLYGGFAGTETALVQRDYVTNVTILDGQQGGSVITVPPGLFGNSGLDGFTVRNGTADYGGGLLCSSASPKILNCTFTANSARHGAGLYFGSSEAVSKVLVGYRYWVGWCRIPV